MATVCVGRFNKMLSSANNCSQIFSCQYNWSGAERPADLEGELYVLPYS